MQNYPQRTEGGYRPKVVRRPCTFRGCIPICWALPQMKTKARFSPPPLTMAKKSKVRTNHLVKVEHQQFRHFSIQQKQLCHQVVAPMQQTIQQLRDKCFEMHLAARWEGQVERTHDIALLAVMSSVSGENAVTLLTI